MTRSSDLEALAARHAALEAELAEQQRELAHSRELLDDARQRRRLPTFVDVRIASPCRADWSRMVGDERVRHCGECKKYVYDLSAMTRAEAEALIGSLEREPCVRYYQRADGTILFSDCAAVRSRRRWSRGAVAGAVLAVGAGMAQLASASSMPPDPDGDVMMEGITMGAMTEDPTVFLGALSEEPEPATEEVARARAVEWAEVVARPPAGTPWRDPPPDPSFLRVYREAVPDDEE